MRPRRLTEDEVKQRLAELPAWSLSAQGDALERSFRFRSFAEAFSFMTEIAFAAERLDHHPEWTNVYARVDVRLTTHDSGGVSERDLALALLMDRAASIRD
ncbi:4a-hydroxytetrahydrobiopterin dehydratase [Rhizobium sp. SSA_523]|uniref:4a-hydroxytetrahydrobiopterin dehydratase n=1 Tax=Rhizobium sp. SSA_523 TaxID=2952477 RepID=UPI00209044F9|nr:4a-hydroxytetrahydrobiopterin dehydratase [Rhizobium sp. SSA_523]MCO5733561.1 4a-hydroxytetrahydrobiopterin dehydratase [Rhizobium sp. SSA_523]WKC23139.1 4a-hydroxytetrahydrobiopterin dehydratase [Rhizobium sp. SSA_523]